MIACNQTPRVNLVSTAVAIMSTRKCSASTHTYEDNARFGKIRLLDFHAWQGCRYIRALNRTA